MRTVLLDLLSLQSLVRRGGVPKLEQLEAITQVRGRIPRSVLDRFDRMISQSRNAVALVHHGTCGECHVRIPISAYASLVNPQEFVVCETCGCYLVLPADEMPAHPRPHNASRPVAA